MELSNLTLTSGEIFDRNVLGAVALRQMDQPPAQSALLHDFDMVVLMLHADKYNERTLTHTFNGDKRTQTIHVGLPALERAVLRGDNNELLTSLMEGEVIWDPQGILGEMRHEILTFSKALKERVLLVEFARFLHLNVKAKRYLDAGCTMDAYNCVLIALYHWARIEVAEAGLFPQPAVWEQVKHLNSPVYKLYEELTVSTETLEQRVELILLGCEFTLMSKMAYCCGLLLDTLGSRKGTWSVKDLLEHPDLCQLEAELPFVLRKMVSRSLIKEITDWAADNGAGHVIRYTL
ncbi:nucleotidyltransferase-like protein [Paenibacillus sp. NFR01]|uniref:nucleotidyltransferase-like protein n=1 Tax=Paenibacillus sp. NFR01 TaxID=1566279 RepID=UPI0008CBB7B3|nr:nucleotidyltransferase-like protein [Paenibacillus sp. NFR01]SEU25089.1 Nucleotidyltransferase-like [Paenibacillus sp. NFR01]